MSLRDLGEAVEGLWDGGVAASGAALVSSSTASRQDLVVHAVAVDRQAAAAVRGRWGGSDGADGAMRTLPLGKFVHNAPLVRHSTKLDAVAFVLSKEWMPPTWLCVVSLQDILTACTPPGSRDGEDGGQTKRTRAYVTVQTPVQDWRTFFASLLRHVNACAMRVEDVDEKAGTAVLHFPSLGCRASIQRVWSSDDAQQLVLWSSSQLARALSLQTETVSALEKTVASTARQLEQATADLTTLARECGRAPLNTQATLTGEPRPGAREAAVTAAPENLVTPQARAGMKRGRGMRIQ